MITPPKKLPSKEHPAEILPFWDLVTVNLVCTLRNTLHLIACFYYANWNSYLRPLIPPSPYSSKPSLTPDNNCHHGPPQDKNIKMPALKYSKGSQHWKSRNQDFRKTESTRRFSYDCQRTEGGDSSLNFCLQQGWFHLKKIPPSYAPEWIIMEFLKNNV